MLTGGQSPQGAGAEVLGWLCLHAVSTPALLTAHQREPLIHCMLLLNLDVLNSVKGFNLNTVCVFWMMDELEPPGEVSCGCVTLLSLCV